LIDIFSQGTTAIVGEYNEVALFYSLIPGSDIGPDGFYSFPCDADLPDISFYFSGQQFSITQSFNLGPDPDNPNLNRCIGSIRAREGAQWWTLGIAFMSNYYTIFDSGQTGVRGAEVGFATLA
jgi:hypothetical protein